MTEQEIAREQVARAVAYEVGSWWRAYGPPEEGEMVWEFRAPIDASVNAHVAVERVMMDLPD